MLSVLLIETQGIHDLESSSEDSSIIFALSLLISSAKIYNTLQYLSTSEIDELNALFAFSQMKDGNAKLGQNFLLLLRDTVGKTGIEGGKEYLEHLKENVQNNNGTNKFVECLDECFDRVDCFRVPRPSRLVMDGVDGGMKAEQCGEEFLRTISECANFVLETLTAKMVGNDCLTGESFKAHVKHVVEHFSHRSANAKSVI
ncbi:unnamed protein product, partial [Mesorhabditis belari]|uniref:Guanylate-binding protein N-terminal domain-containing protein n=1 Tax=Mesorhabditis belari TaxID=2138241 RepID=A0AAF3J5F9_9BILA